jgi:hypothetical protein
LAGLIVLLGYTFTACIVTAGILRMAVGWFANSVLLLAVVAAIPSCLLVFPDHGVFGVAYFIALILAVLGVVGVASGFVCYVVIGRR